MLVRSDLRMQFIDANVALPSYLYQVFFLSFPRAHRVLLSSRVTTDGELFLSLRAVLFLFFQRWWQKGITVWTYENNSWLLFLIMGLTLQYFTQHRLSLVTNLAFYQVRYARQLFEKRHGYGRGTTLFTKFLFILCTRFAWCFLRTPLIFREIELFLTDFSD